MRQQRKLQLLLQQWKQNKHQLKPQLLLLIISFYKIIIIIINNNRKKEKKNNVEKMDISVNLKRRRESGDSQVEEGDKKNIKKKPR